MRSLRVKKRIIGVSTLILAIVLANIPIYTRAAAVVKDHGNCGSGLNWEIYNIDLRKADGTLYGIGDGYITAESAGEYDTADSEDLILVIKGSGAISDATINGGIVDTEWKQYASKITKVALATSTTPGSGITTIGSYAFYGLTNLKSVISILPDPITGVYTVVDSDPPEGKFDLPNYVTSIRGGAFAGCTSLNGELNLKNVTSLGEEVFMDCESLKGELILPSGLTTIPDRAFMGCTGLSGSLNLSNVSSIGNSAFEGCSGLNSLTIGGQITSISDRAFALCSNINSPLSIPNQVTAIGNSAFSGCMSIPSLYIDGNNSSLTQLGEYAFKGCEAISGAVHIPAGVTMISTGAFEDCSSISKINISPQTGGNDLTIGARAFFNCSSLEDKMFLPERVKLIDVGAFYGANLINEVHFGGDAPTIPKGGEGGPANSFNQSFRSEVVYLKFPKTASGWTFPKYAGYNTFVLPTGDNFTVNDERQEDANNSITYDSTQPMTQAAFLTQGNINPTHDFGVDHTLVVTDTDSTVLTNQINLGPGQKMVVYNLEMMEYLTVALTQMHKPCDETYEMQVQMQIPKSFDLRDGKIAGIYGLDQSGQSVWLGDYTPTDSTVQFNFGNKNIYEVLSGLNTVRHGDIAIVYESFAKEFHIEDKRSDTIGASVLRAGFTNTTVAYDNSQYDGYYLEIKDGDPKGAKGTEDYLPDLEELLEDRADSPHIIAGYNIRLMYDDGSGAVEEEVIPGPSGTSHRLTIRIPLPRAISDAIDNDTHPENGKLVLYTTPLNYQRRIIPSPKKYEVIPYSREPEGEGVKYAEFTVTHFSAFGFVYTPSTSTEDPYFDFVDQRDASNVNDIGDKTSNSFKTSLTGSDQLRGYTLRLQEIDDVALREPFKQELAIDESIGQSYRVYKLTLVDKNNNEIDPTPLLIDPIEVTIPIPRRGLLDGTEWNPREADTIKGYWRNGDTGAFDTQPVVGKSSDDVETVTFEMPKNGQLALVYTPRPATVDDDFAIVEDWLTKLRNPDKNRSERYTSLTASYRDENPQQHKGWKLYVDLVDENAQPYSNFKTALQKAGELDDDELMYVVSLDLRNEYDQSVNPDTTLQVTMPILSMATGTPWDMDAIDSGSATVKAYRYYLTPPPNSEPTNWDGFNADQPTVTTTTVGDVRALRFSMDEMLLNSERPGYVAVVYTPDRTINPFTVDASSTGIPDWENKIKASFVGVGVEDKYGGYKLVVTPPANNVLRGLIPTTPTRALMVYDYTLIDPNNNPVTGEYDMLTVNFVIPESTGTGTNTVTWDLTPPASINGVFTYKDSEGTTIVDHSPEETTNAVTGQERLLSFRMNKNSEYGIQYMKEAIEFKVLDQRSPGVVAGSKVLVTEDPSPNYTYSGNYNNFDGDRYLIFRDPTSLQASLRQQILSDTVKGFNTPSEPKEIAIYDIVFQDQRTNGTDQPDHGAENRQVTIYMNPPSSMDLSKGKIKVATLDKNGVLEDEVPSATNEGLNQIRFYPRHFSDYALVYYDNASSTNASTGDSSSSNASTATTSSTDTTTSTGATTSSTSGTTNTGATSSTTGGTGSGSGSTASNNSTTWSTTSGGGSTNSGSGSGSGTGSDGKPDMPKTGDPGMYRMMGSAALGLFGIYELISSIRVREERSRRRLYRR